MELLLIAKPESQSGLIVRTFGRLNTWRLAKNFAGGSFMTPYIGSKAQTRMSELTALGVLECRWSGVKSIFGSYFKEWRLKKGLVVKRILIEGKEQIAVFKK